MDSAIEYIPVDRREGDWHVTGGELIIPDRSKVWSAREFFEQACRTIGGTPKTDTSLVCILPDMGTIDMINFEIDSQPGGIEVHTAVESHASNAYKTIYTKDPLRCTFLKQVRGDKSAPAETIRSIYCKTFSGDLISLEAHYGATTDYVDSTYTRGSDMMSTVVWASRRLI